MVRFDGLSRVVLVALIESGDKGPYPEINLEVSTSSKFSVTNLERDCHFIIPVQFLVEAFSRVRLELDGVGCCGRYPSQRSDQQCCCGESHVVEL